MMKKVGIVCLTAIFLIVLVFGGLAWRYYMAPIHGAVDAEQKIESANSRIQNYERFFNQCSSIQTMKSSLDAQKSILESAEDSQERSRIRSNIAGMQAQLARYVNQYNADVKKSYTIARFKDSSLPAQVSVNGTTICQ